MLAVLAKSQQLGEERVVCDLCSIRRADVRTPCGHALHARCIYQLPLSECPVCRADMTQSEGLQVLPVEPHNNEPAENADTELRTGRWHHYETQYAQHLMEDFEAGTLPIGEGTKLATLLCRLLNCNQTRLSKKLKIGKRFYAHGPTRIRTPEAIAAHSVRQRRISELEEMFLMAEAQTARGALTTPGLSEKMQTEWRERFVGHAHSMNQKLKDAWSWNSKRRVSDLSTTNTSAAINKLLSSIAPTSSSNSTGGGDFSVSPMAPLFLVQVIVF
ncbi:hypothetical protein JKP88DRAFT_200737 [Tribonema minus]|uniref:RING-type domain-containing protein n=1 Tax=Tribonema minus TaxID=303371 RepID=A0A836CDJ8_9STRA|nr:hypothetical protein JKP88DRAFT_200737 [Tribonema minus]